MVRLKPIAILAAMILSPSLSASPAAKILGSSTCVVNAGQGRVTLGAAPRAKLFATDYELLFDFFDVTFGTGQPVSYNAGHWYGKSEGQIVYANMRFTVFVPEDQDGNTYQAIVYWDDASHYPDEWESSPRSATLTMTCTLGEQAVVDPLFDLAGQR